RGINLVPKGMRGMRRVIQAIENGETLGILVDQKMNTGIDVPFFGMSAKTTQLPATLALKYGMPIVLCTVVRKNGVNYQFSATPLEYSKDQSPEKITASINTALETWISSYKS